MKLVVTYKFDPKELAASDRKSIREEITGRGYVKQDFAQDGSYIVAEYEGSAWDCAEAHREVFYEFQTYGLYVEMEPEEAERMPEQIARAAARDAVTVVENLQKRGRVAVAKIDLADLRRRLSAVAGEEE
jgi:hypothetical protein